MASSSKKLGNIGEGIALNALKRIGVLMPEEIGTPFTVTGHVRGKMLKGFFKEPVSGDIRGHRSDGVSILAEVKTHQGKTLPWSILTKHGEHQAARLDQHAAHAISLLIWVRAYNEVYIMNWPVPGYAPRKSITLEKAEQLSIRTKGDLDMAGPYENVHICNCEACTGQKSLF